MKTDSGRRELKGAHDAQEPGEAGDVEKADSLQPVEEGFGDSGAASAINPQEIAALAYQYWEESGRPENSAEQDWFRAERMLRSQARTHN